MKFTIKGSGKSVELNQSHFVAKGGEGSIYAKGGRSYKICEPGKVIPEGKFNELAVLNRPTIIRPEEMLLDASNQPVGYASKFVSDAVVLCSMFTQAFRNREGVQPDQVLALVRQMQETIDFIHQKDVLLVDLNEFNFLVDKPFKNVYFIDVNSYQTRHYPATAIMDSIRDRHCGTKWSRETDWFSFAIVSFQMFIGIHPFKGRHPKFPNIKTSMDERMKANISVFNSQVSYPKAACMPFDVIPEAYRRWYEAVFDRGQRVAPPKDLHQVAAVAAIVRHVVGSNSFEIKELRAFAADIMRYYTSYNKDVFVMKSTVEIDRLSKPIPNPRAVIGFTPDTNLPVAAWVENRKLKLRELESGDDLSIDVDVDTLFSTDNRIYARSRTVVYEIQFLKLGNQFLAHSHSVANVMEFATKFYDGVLIQNLFDAYYVSVFPKTQEHIQFPLRELDGYKIVDAKYEGRVLMVLAANQTGRYDRFVFRFSSDWNTHDCRTIEDVTSANLNFTVLDNGICVCLTEEEKIEIFPNKKDNPNIKVIDDPAIEADMQLTHKGSQTLFVRGGKLYSLKMR